MRQHVLTIVAVWCLALVCLIEPVVSAKPYFLHKKSSWDLFIGTTTLPGADLTRSNLLRMVTHNALLDAFFLQQPLMPLERLGAYQQGLREELQWPSLVDLTRAVMLVRDVHIAKMATYNMRANDETLLYLKHHEQINAIDKITNNLPPEERRLALIDFLLANTTRGEEGSNFLPTILYASVIPALPPAVRNDELGAAFVSTTDSWKVRDQHGKLLADIAEDVNHAALAALPQAQLDAALMRISQALQFIIAQHTEAEQDNYWNGSTETERQAYQQLATQELPVLQRQLEKIKKIQANPDTEQRKAATVAFLLSYIS